MENPVFTDKRIKIWLHALLWIIISIFPFYISRIMGFSEMRQLGHFYSTAIAYGCTFYIVYLYLIPKYYFTNRKGIFLIEILVLITLLFLLLIFINDHLLSDPERDKRFEEAMQQLNKSKDYVRPPFKLFRLINFYFTSFLITGFALGLSFMERHRADEKKRKELEKEKLHSELAFLKNQISPHFFFNTLNNIYTLTGIDTPTAQESIIKLSKLMRYLLYESEIDETQISKEIGFMNNYIDLMKLRLSPKVELNVNFPSDYKDTFLPPLLFIPFIENAFKHGISNREASFIHIEMEIEPNLIRFTTENSFGRSNQPSDEEHSGIGLENVKKRLALLFPRKHKLEINADKEVFRVSLNIELNPAT